MKKFSLVTALLMWSICCKSAIFQNYFTTNSSPGAVAKQVVYVSVFGNDNNTNSCTNEFSALATISKAINVASNLSKIISPVTIKVLAGSYDCSTNLLRFPPNVSLMGEGRPILLSTLFANTNDPNSAVAAPGGARFIPGNNGTYEGFNLRVYPTDSNSVQTLWIPASGNDVYWSGIGGTTDADAFTNVTLRAVKVENAPFDSFFVGCYNTGDATNAIFSATLVDCDFGTRQYPAITDTIALSGGIGSRFTIQNCRAYMDAGYWDVHNIGSYSAYNTYLRVNGYPMVEVNGYYAIMTNSSIGLTGGDGTSFYGLVSSGTGKCNFNSGTLEAYGKAAIGYLNMPGDVSNDTNFTGFIDFYSAANQYQANGGTVKLGRNIVFIGYQNLILNNSLLTATNFIDGARYTNTYPQTICVAASPVWTVAAVAGAVNESLCIEALPVNGGTTNVCAASTLATSIAMIYTNSPLIGFVPTNAVYYFTNRSTGAGNSAKIVGGQLKYP